MRRIAAIRAVAVLVRDRNEAPVLSNMLLLSQAAADIVGLEAPSTHVEADGRTRFGDPATQRHFTGPLKRREMNKPLGVVENHGIALPVQ